jgi:membrane protein
MWRRGSQNWFMKKLQNLYRLVREIVSVWMEGNTSSMGAAVAYYTIFAIAPLFIFVLAVAGFLFGHEAAQRELFSQVSSLVGHSGGEAIQATVAAADRPRAGVFATAIALIALFVGAGSVFVQLQSSLNAIWKVRPRPGQGLHNFIKSRLLSFAMLLGIGFLLLVSLVISAALAAAGKFMSTVIPAQEVAWHLVDFIVSLGLVTLLFAMIFKILPDVTLTWRDVWIGAFITALLFGLGKFLLGFYLGRSMLASAYGAAGSLVVLLIWVYYSVQILLFGAAVTRVWANKFGSHAEPVAGAEFISG